MAIRFELSDDFIAALESRTASFEKDLEAAGTRKAAEKVLRRRFGAFNAFTAAIEHLQQTPEPLTNLVFRGTSKNGDVIYTFTLKGWEASFVLDETSACCTAMEVYEVSFLLRKRKT